MDSSLLVWALRIRETEALLTSRQLERDVQAARRQGLVDQLQEREAQQACSEQRELRARERLARSQHVVLQRRSELMRLQGQADSGESLLSFRGTRRSLERQRDRATSAAEVEARRCAAFNRRVSERKMELAEPVRQLTATLAKVEQRLSYARQTYDMASLTIQLDAQRARRQALQVDADAKRTNLETVLKQVEEDQGRVVTREQRNVEAVERSQAALREVRTALAAHSQRQVEARQRRLHDARSQRVAAASRLADLQRATDAARQTLSCLDADSTRQQQEQQQQPQRQPP